MRINIYGGPGSGKSTVAAMLFVELKQRHYKVEIVHEYVKGWCWENRLPESFDQHYIFSKQMHAEDILVRRGVHTVSDSPLWMQCAYMLRDNAPFLPEKLSECRKWDEIYPAINILLERLVPYDAAGRYQTLDEAIKMDQIIQQILDENKLNYTTIPATDKHALVDHVLQELGVGL